MNDDKLKGKWNQVKGEAKKQWGEMTGDESTRLEGNVDKAKGKVQEEYGEAKDRTARAVNDLVDDEDRDNL
ncbi:CsbD family protein [Aneurinibacillus tyrosinisolvens]|uniref:CsbD family protein n=1 Tax=Aneurinibacillus tyrosinisolvens TaxID=1443435 RepID=UPI00063F9B41|nr:CsbD family protein [Aneurinibacillus tyrosinisolvens]